MSKSVGGLWKPKQRKENSPIMMGVIEIINGIPQQIAIFPNKKKTKDNQPDYNIVLNDQRKEQENKPIVGGNKGREFDEEF